MFRATRPARHRRSLRRPRNTTPTLTGTDARAVPDVEAHIHRVALDCSSIGDRLQHQVAHHPEVGTGGTQSRCSGHVDDCHVFPWIYPEIGAEEAAPRVVADGPGLRGNAGGGAYGESQAETVARP